MRTLKNRNMKLCAMFVSSLVIVSWMYIHRNVDYTNCPGPEVKVFEQQGLHGVIVTADPERNQFAKESSQERNSSEVSIMMWRAKYVHKMCEQIIWNASYVHARTPVFFYSKPNGLLACKSPKTGSTFMGALIRALNQPSINKVSGMFLLGRNKIHNGLHEVWDILAAEPIKQSTLTVMITRDPYSRLFSTFVDKYFLLGRLGRELATHLKRGFREDRNNEYCGYDITFQEFLDYIVFLAQSMKELNEHMVPVAQLCDVCNMKYDLICRQESLSEGITEVLRLTKNVTSSRLNAIRQSINTTSPYASMLSLISSQIFDYNNHRQDCPNQLSFMRKMWKTFQVQGLVNSVIKFPEEIFSGFLFVEKEAQAITSASLQVIQSNPLSKKQRQQQRLTALTIAYRNIRWQTIVNLQKVFKLDFLLFGYSNYPPIIYNITRTTNGYI
ncbi:uncharacterized protein LOC110466747 isoform X1 [Mizuhopecten yessoensis]|uniref:uncharacterized protein LOC110466747 isoform X1 n=1 Tax=Mizuhopecten yessoensis TaxID=6573 RepID=UPI000B45C589|nr:uncharacterized protein LOC110466747 isoform X1 [Mizuhopecten yessoensis]